MADKEAPPRKVVKTKVLRRQAVKLLIQHGKGNPPALALAAKIAACRPKARCGSQGCPTCLALAQAKNVELIREFLEGRSLTMANVVVPSSGIAIGELDEHVFEATRAAVTKALTEAGFRWAVGGFDLSANEHENGRFEPYWQPHLVFFAPDSIRGEREKAFRRFFPATTRVPKPIMMKSFDGDAAGIYYSLKNDFVRRVTLAGKRLADGTRRRRNTRDRFLRAGQKLELMLAFDKMGEMARVFLHGVHIDELPSGPMIVKNRN